MDIIPLRLCGNYTTAEVGGKCRLLGRFYRYDILNIGHGICLATSCLRRFLGNEGEYEDIIRFLDEIKSSPIRMRSNLQRVREIIASSAPDEKIIESVISALANEGVELGDGVAVRSSGILEDSANKSMAGVYHSAINVTERNVLISEIKNVWISLFSETSYLCAGADNIASGMAVIIQKMVYGDWYGVLFSRDPGDKGSNTMLLECSTKNAAVVNGEEPEQRVYIDRIGKGQIKESMLATTILDKLRTIGIFLEEKLETPVDIEWCCRELDVSVLQVRPSVGANIESDEVVVLDQDDISECSKHDLLQCAPFFMRHLGKNRAFREIAKREGFELYRNIFVIYSRRNLSEFRVKRLRDYIRTDMVIMKYSVGAKSLYCRFTEIKDVLERHLPKGDGAICVSIGERMSPRLSGYSSITEAGDVFVEYVPGAMKNLIEGTMPPVKALLTDAKINTYLEVPYYNNILAADRETAELKLADYKRPGEPLSTEEVERIWEYTVVFSRELKQPRLEWYFCGDGLYAKDISMETEGLEIDIENINIVSSGTAKGRALFIEDIGEIESLVEKYKISLIPHSEEEEIIREDAVIKKIIREIESIGGDVILFSSMPVKGLLPIIDYIKGVVFESGAILSHVGIALREKRIPAVINKEVYSMAKRCDEVVLSGGRTSIITTGAAA